MVASIHLFSLLGWYDQVQDNLETCTASSYTFQEVGHKE